MTFERAHAVPFISNSGLEVDVREHSKDLIGHAAINAAVEETVPEYDKTLHFGLETSAKERHDRLGGLAFGKIQHDIAKLNGLAGAIDNISGVIRDGKAQLAHDWKGESYDAFRTNIENLEKTLNDYKAAVETTAKGLETALSGIRTGYHDYGRHCRQNHFAWGDLPKPGTWWRMSADSAEFLAENCNAPHGMWNCFYNEPEYVSLIDGKLTNDPVFNDNLAKWDCTQDDGVVRSQFRWAVETAVDERKAIHRKIDAYCAEADGLRDLVGEAYDASLDNLRILAETSVFANLSVPGGTAPAGAGDPGQGGPGGGGPGGGGGGYPGPGGGGGAPGGGEATMPPPLPNPAPEPAPVEPAAAAAPEPAQPQADQGTVTIKDGDRSVSVTSPDGEGHVKVTVEGADGKAKSYDLDFDAASGMESRPGAEGDKAAGPGAERVPAGTNGQCVIKDGPLTITAERPLFDPGTIKLEVDDGVNEPTVYSLDFDETPGDADRPAGGNTDRAEDGGNAPAEPDGSTTGGGPAEAGVATEAEPAADNGKPGEKEQLTSPQAVLPGDPGSQQGPVVPDQSTGEAELASAGAGEPADPAGNSAAGAMPMMAGAGSGAGGDAGRAGTGWSVHGDLFDNHDPVYSMHGVLGEDDLEGR